MPEEPAILSVGVDIPAAGSAEQRRLLNAAQGGAADGGSVATLVVDYPSSSSIFPPEIVAPRFLWHDPAGSSDRWLIDVSLDDGRAHIYVLTDGAPPPPGEIDPRCLGPTNQAYQPTP